MKMYIAAIASKEPNTLICTTVTSKRPRKLAGHWFSVIIDDNARIAPHACIRALSTMTKMNVFSYNYNYAYAGEA